MNIPEKLSLTSAEFWDPLPVGDEKPLQPLSRVSLCPEYQYPPPPEKWPAIPTRDYLGIEIPNDPELIRWALSQAAKTIKRRSITPAPTCGSSKAEREYYQHLNAIVAIRAQEALKAEIIAHSKEFLRAFVTLRKGGQI